MQANEAHSIVAEGQQLFSELLKVPNKKVEKFRDEILEKFEDWKHEALDFMPKGVNRKIQRELSKLFKKFENFFFKAGKTKRSTGRGRCKFEFSKTLSDVWESISEEQKIVLNLA